MYSNEKNSCLTLNPLQQQKNQLRFELAMTSARALIDIQFLCPLILVNFLPEKMDHFGRRSAN